MDILQALLSWLRQQSTSVIGFFGVIVGALVAAGAQGAQRKAQSRAAMAAELADAASALQQAVERFMTASHKENYRVVAFEPVRALRHEARRRAIRYRMLGDRTMTRRARDLHTLALRLDEGGAHWMYDGTDMPLYEAAHDLAVWLDSGMRKMPRSAKPRPRSRS
ncbi:hypothetical protein FHX74_003202 [Friedmanniella endophytica]|uniref:Uncharacterized protein n=1 Tax=Microlunatus kandeliicorticis TaxID=1759536 RepID=A0A7W3IUM2_9ACTN|nr:hypothetical protein [Microlunatus kandeliicorticis]MBA8795566.1 hypothetical protein [Microlunatus kandeliicorticis]